MRFWHSILSAFCAIAIWAVPASAQGPSALRQLVEVGDQSNWLSVGRLNVTGLGFCTATLVSADLVLTAAHCIVDKRSLKVVAPDRVHFLAGFRKGEYSAHRTASAIAVAEGFDRQRQTLKSDIALIRLAEPIADDVLPMGVASGIRKGDSVAAVSYSIDRSQIQSHQSDCMVLQLRQRILYTSCEGVPGVSGAPIFRIEDGTPQLIGVASSVASRSKSKVPRGNLIAVLPTPDVMDQLLGDLGVTSVMSDKMGL